MMPDEFDPETDRELTPMEMNGAVHNEMYETWKRAGFTDDQALEFTKIAIAAAFGATFKL